MGLYHFDTPTQVLSQLYVVRCHLLWWGKIFIGQNRQYATILLAPWHIVLEDLGQPFGSIVAIIRLRYGSDVTHYVYKDEQFALH